MESPTSIRIPDDLLAKIDAEGKRGTVINRILRAHYKESESGWEGSPEADQFQHLAKASTEVGKPIYVKIPEQWIARHDSKNCRIYRCGMCAATKKKP